jgi:arylsulfatase A-like enzyme
MVVYVPVSLRDLPATVVDLLGLSTDSPFPGHSLAACWRSSAAEDPELTSPALSEQADATAFEGKPTSRGSNPGFQMSLVTSGYHYVRTGLGDEQLYDLASDPYEQRDLMESPDANRLVAVFRRRLLEVLSENTGSVEAEAGYLRDYRNSLEALVARTVPPIAASP